MVSLSPHFYPVKSFGASAFPQAQVQPSVVSTAPVAPLLPAPANNGELQPAGHHGVIKHQASDKTDPSPKAGTLAALSPLSLAFPAMMAVAAPMLMVSGALGARSLQEEGQSVVRHMGGKGFELAKKVLPGLNADSIINTYKTAHTLMGLAMVPKGALMVRYGLQTGQPTTIAAGLAQMVLGPAAAKSFNPTTAKLLYATDAAQLVGVANAQQNEPLVQQDKPPATFYNFKHLQEAMTSGNDMPLKERKLLIGREVARLGSFLVHDQIQTVKAGVGEGVSLVKAATHGALHPFELAKEAKQEAASLKPAHGKQKDTDTPDPKTLTAQNAQAVVHGRELANFNRLAVVTTYAGLLPTVLKPLVPQVAKPMLEAIEPKLLNPALLLSGVSLAAVGLSGKTPLDQTPALGQLLEKPATVVANLTASLPGAAGLTPVARGLEQLGSALTSLYYGSRQTVEGTTQMG